MAQVTPDKSKAEKPVKPAPKQAARPGPKMAPKPEARMYLGPVLPGQAFIPGQIYKGGLPPIAGEPEDVELIKPLFVPVPGLAQAKKDLADPTTAFAKAYRAAAEKIGG